MQRKLQKKGGKTEEDLADILSAHSSRSKGEVLSLLTDLPKVVEEILKNGESVSIKGLDTFHAAITSNGFEHPEDVLPHEVRLSRVYFVADRKFTYRVSLMKFFRYPLSKYFPKHLLRPQTGEEEKAQEAEPEFSEEEGQ